MEYKDITHVSSIDDRMMRKIVHKGVEMEITNELYVKMREEYEGSRTVGQGLLSQIAGVNNYQPLTPTALQRVTRIARAENIGGRPQLIFHEGANSYNQADWQAIRAMWSGQPEDKVQLDPDGNECPQLHNIFTGKEMSTIVPDKSSGIEDMLDFETSFLNTRRARYREGGLVEENDPSFPTEYLRSTGLEVRRPVLPIPPLSHYVAGVDPYDEYPFGDSQSDGIIHNTPRRIGMSQAKMQMDLQQAENMIQYNRQMAQAVIEQHKGEEEKKGEDRYNYWNLVKRLRKYFTVKLTGE